MRKMCIFFFSLFFFEMNIKWHVEEDRFEVNFVAFCILLFPVTVSASDTISVTVVSGSNPTSVDFVSGSPSDVSTDRVEVIQSSGY